MAKCQAAGIKSQMLVCRIGCAIFGIACDRAMDGSHLCTDLVLSSGVQLDLCDTAGIIVYLQNAESQTGKFGIGIVGVADVHMIGMGIFGKVVLKNALPRDRDAAKFSQIELSETAFPELAVQFTSRSFGFGKYQNAGGGLVQTMDDSQVWFAGNIGRFRNMILQDTHHVRSTYALALSGDSCGFYAFNNLFIFI